MKTTKSMSSLAGVLVALAALFLTVTAQAQGPVVVSDKDDYGPGETAYFSATGFEPFEFLDFSIAISDGNGLWIPDVAWADIPADESGGATAQYVVPQTWLDKTLQLTVMGLSSGLIAQTTFTDSNPNSITVGTQSPNQIAPGDDATYTVTLRSVGNDNACSVTLSVLGLPAGATATFIPNPLPVTETDGVKFDFSTLTISTNGTTLPGMYVFTVSGANGSGCQGTGPSSGNGTLLVAESEDNNTPPIITCLDPTADLGAKVGCLVDGTLQADFDVSYIVVDGDGNSKIVQAIFTTPGGDVTVDVANVTDADEDDIIDVVLDPLTDTLTFSDPGFSSELFSVHITADDNANEPVETDCGGTADAQIVYDFNGFFSPLGGQINCKVKNGSTVPVKFSITDCGGTAISTGEHTISVVHLVGCVPDGPVDVEDAGKSNGDTEFFRWDPTGMQWIFNLKTGTIYNYAAGKTYQITAHLDDGTDHKVTIAIK